MITDFSFLAPAGEHYFPLEECCSLEFKVKYAPISFSDYQFDLFNYDDISDLGLDEYFDKSDAGGHKLLGDPDFTQEDPRAYLPDEEPYILLMQIDTDSNDESIHVQWGDMGIGNFFIRESALSQLNFSDIFYNWDCG